MTIATANDQQLSSFSRFLTGWTCSGALHFVWLCSWVWLPDILLFHQPTEPFLCLLKLLPNCCPTDQEFILYLYTVNKNNNLFVSFNIRKNLTNVHVSPCQREKLLFIWNYKLSSTWHWIKEVRTKGVAILQSSGGKPWKLLNEINDWSKRPFTKEPKKNHIQ